MSEEEIHCLYNNSKVKAYYTTTHGEGYGLPIFEAAYSGLPVIATGWSGHLDFMKSDKNKKIKFAKIDFELKEIQKEAVWKDIIPEGSKWAYPKERSIKNQLEKVYKNHGMYKKWALSLQEEILENYSRDKVLKMMYNSIFEGVESESPQESEEELLIL
jgi:glycosyltransferase involved in cell wall biosynthesis